LQNGKKEKGLNGLMSNKILDALRAKYEAEISMGLANVDVYIKNPIGIGEHPDLVMAVDSEIEKIASANDKLNILKDIIV
jgi:hypothetical protein